MTVTDMKDHQRRVHLDEIEEAFREVFPDERLVSVECESTDRGQIFAITSNMKTRRYLRTEDQAVEDVLRNTPAFPEQKDEK